MDIKQLAEASAVREARNAWRSNWSTLLCRIALVASDIRRAIEDDDGDAERLREVLVAARGQLSELLRIEGAELFGKPGDPVDPHLCEINEVREPRTMTRVVLEVLREGLILDAEVVQKAEVIVSATPPPKPK